ncbi:MAG: hypothetical protein GXO33_03570 [Epsilonproteobacteria bacterium]|nr:hypothetical protein [Campylobacterota bacterium]
MKKWWIALGCALALYGGDNVAPGAVTARFWEAYAKGDENLTRALSVRGEVEADVPFALHKVRVRVEDVNVTGPVAEVKTRLIYALALDKKGTTLPCESGFETELLRIDGKWRVDGRSTMPRFEKALAQSALSCGVKSFEQSFQQELKAFNTWMEELFKEDGPLDQTLEEGLKEAEKQMRRMMERLKKEGETPTPDPLPPADRGERI